MAPLSLLMEKILDVDVSWLGALQFQDRIPALAGILGQYRTTPIFIALCAHLAREDDIPGKLFPEQSDKGKAFFEAYLPDRIRLDRRRLSDYRIGGAAAVQFRVELDAAGVDLFQDQIITKLIDLPKAVKLYGNKPEVFRSFVAMSASDFSQYSRGVATEVTSQESPLERYLNVYEHQRSVLSL